MLDWEDKKVPDLKITFEDNATFQEWLEEILSPENLSRIPKEHKDSTSPVNAVESSIAGTEKLGQGTEVSKEETIFRGDSVKNRLA